MASIALLVNNSGNSQNESQKEKNILLSAFATYALLSRHSWGKLTRKAITARKRKIDYDY